MTDGATNGRRSRWQLLLLFVLFFGPLAMAWVLYYGSGGWRPEGRSNHGVLIEPPTPLPETALVLADGSSTEPDVLRHVWTLLYVDDGVCAEACQEALYRSRQVRIALGKEIDRVQRLYLYRGDKIDLASDHPDLIVAEANSPGGLDLVAAFPPDERPDRDNIYLVDPLGNLMMRFPLEDDARDILLDLKKLLKLSRIG
jgi:cytochrome oxidase Cu insertion factor (SCO1/SenC/PrrC family)